MTVNIPEKLFDVRQAFRAHGFDLRLVGGVVRDHVQGVSCKDVDLHTDATPDECVALYNQAGVRWEPTGLDHGTTTVILDHVPYEITSLRLDTQTDGRHAQVQFTRDWCEDLRRRDLTFNAMSMSFEGDILDPFGGREDLKSGRVRFVGDPHERIQEDYLRILRWFRFRGRFETSDKCDEHAEDAVAQLCHGLDDISRERVWMEMSKILSGPRNMLMLQHMYVLNVNNYICLPDVSPFKMHAAGKLDKHADAVTVITCLYRWGAKDILQAWKTSKELQQKSNWLNDHVGQNPFRLMAVNTQVPRAWVCDLERLTCAIMHDQMDPMRMHMLQVWDPPEFPVTGHDLIRAGIKPGPVYGDILTIMKSAWADSDYQLTQSDLLKIAEKYV
jgi:tRNA nucleotidyltransferase (CCA-adding enzyme)